MKASVIILLSGLFIYGCIPSKQLTEEQSAKVYEHSVTLSKDEIKQKVIFFVNEKFISGKAVTQNTEEGLFTGNGIVNLPDLPFGAGVVKMELTFMVKYMDNNYKVKWIVKDLSNNKGSFDPGMWGYYSEYIEKSISKNDKDLFDYMTGKTGTF